MSYPAPPLRAETPGVDSDTPSLVPPRRGGGRLLDARCRALDIVGSLALLLILGPLLAVIAILVRLDSPGPAVFRQERIGRGRKPFTVRKFRSMYVGVAPDRHREFVLGLINGDPPKHDLPERASDSQSTGEDNTSAHYYKMIADPRVTRFGRLLRRSSLDELPQLWNVLRGDMSLVGPRPSIPYEVESYRSAWLTRFAVKPGITGLWQVSGRSTVTFEEMIDLDIEYARRRSLWFNLWILLRTIPVVVGTRGAW